MGSGPLDYSSDRHMAEVWERCKSSNVLHKKGKRVRMGRWWSLLAACHDMQGEEVLLLLILVYVGMREKFWTSIWQSPLCKATLSQEPEPGGVEGEEPAEAAGAAVPAADTAPGVSKPRTVRESNKEVEAKRKTAKKHTGIVHHAPRKSSP